MDESEESQLEAAIRASLEQAQAPSSHPLTFSVSDSEDELYCPSTGGSDMEAEFDTCCVVPQYGTPESRSWEETDSVTVLSSTNVRIKKRDEVSSCDEGACVVRQSGSVNSQLSPRIKVKDCTVDVIPVTVENLSRKRKSSEDGSGELVEKARRIDHLESMKHTMLRTDDSKPERQTHFQKGQRSNSSKGKGRARVQHSQTDSAAIVVDSTEDQLASGAIEKDSVTQLLFRLPDGTRLQKAFVCHHPIQVGTRVQM